METSINSNVESVIKNVSKIEELKKYPVAMALTKAGFKQIKHEDFHKRFACQAITDAYNKQQINKARKDLKELNEKRGMELKNCNPDREIGKIEFRIFEDGYPKLRVNHECYGGENAAELLLGFEGYHDREYRGGECVVKVNKLDYYAEDIMPKHCAEVLDLSKQLGAFNFYIAYPVLVEMRKKDPIVFCILKDKPLLMPIWGGKMAPFPSQFGGGSEEENTEETMFEITWWE